MRVSKKFYKDIKTIFPFHGKRERLFLNQLSIQINEYADEHDDCTYNDLQNEFGTPIEILKSYYDSIDSEYLLKKMENKTIMNAFVIGFIFILLILCFTYTLNSL